MAGSPDNNRQTRLALSRDARLELLDHVAYTRAGLSAREWELVRRLCEALEGSTDRAHQANVKALATKCRCSERTVYRAASCGRRAGMIFTVPTYDDRGRSASEWHVAWDRLAVLAGWIRPGDSPTPGWQSPPGVGSHRRNLAGTDAAWQSPTFCIASPSGKLLTNTKPPTSHPVQGSNREANGGPNRGDRGGRAEDFLILEQELYAAGVDRAARAIATAREQGLDADQVAAIVAHWRAHGGGTNYAAWGPGALCWRLTNARPGEAPDRGWPQPAPVFERYRQQCRERERYARDARARELARQESIDASRGPSIAEQFRAALRERNR